MIRDCAWCGKVRERGLPDPEWHTGEEEPRTSGICDACLAKVTSELDAEEAEEAGRDPIR